MQIRYLVRMSVSDLRKLSTIAILILISVSALFITGFYNCTTTYTEADEYFDKQMWPADILIRGSTNVTTIVENIKKIDGVKWIVSHGDGITVLNAINYNHKEYSISIGWCNVDDPTFPDPKFLIEGNFFKNNNENAIIIENFGKKLLEDINVTVKVGENGTKIKMFDTLFTIIGVIANPLDIGNEEGYITRLTNIINFYVPLTTYYRLISKFKNPTQHYSTSYISTENTYTLKGLYLPPGSDIYVKVKEGYSVEKIANKIREMYPTLQIDTIVEYRQRRTQVAYKTIPFIGASFIFIGLTMVWEVRHRKKEDSTLKAIGWSFKDLSLFYILRDTFLALIATVLSVFYVILMSLTETASINMYQLRLFFLQIIPVIPAVIVGTLVLSVPSMYIAYRISVEEAIRT